MATFFSGWRRRIGVVTLVIAILFMGLWIRGRGIKDTINFGSNHKMVYRSLETFPSGILWERSGNNEVTQYTAGWDCRPLNPWEFGGTHPYSSEMHYFHWRWRLCGFEFGSVVSQSFDGTTLNPLPPDEEDSAMTFWFIAYWFLVVPLTLLSAYLLLTKNPVHRSISSRRMLVSDVG